MSRATAAILRIALGAALVAAGACSKKAPNAPTRKLKAKDEVTVDNGASSVKVNPDGSIAVMMGAAPDGIEYSVARTALARPKIGDRFYVTSVFMQIFGPDAAPAVAPLVLNNLAAFGAPCDQLGRVGGNNCNGRSSFSHMTMVPFSMATREGYRLRTCERLTFDDETLKYAVGQLEGSTLLDPPASRDVDKVYEQFYPGQLPTAGVRDSLLALATKAAAGAPALDGWRFLYLTICSSPDWQLL